MTDYPSEAEESPPVVSNWKKIKERQWTDSDVRDLIYMWQPQECLHNTQDNSTKFYQIILPKEIEPWKEYQGKYMYQIRKSQKNGWFKEFL